MTTREIYDILNSCIDYEDFIKTHRELTDDIIKIQKDHWKPFHFAVRGMKNYHLTNHKNRFKNDYWRHLHDLVNLYDVPIQLPKEEIKNRVIERCRQLENESIECWKQRQTEFTEYRNQKETDYKILKYFTNEC